jgi:hypothetical protein
MVLFTAVLFAGCGKETDKKDYVARVNDSFLTKNDLKEMSDTSFRNNFYKNELIRNWIDEELLYQQAVNDGIIDDEEFHRILNDSRRKLAGVLLLKQVSDQYEFDYNKDDLEKFYRMYNDEFKLTNDGYLLNIVEFSKEEEAIDFRNSVLQNEWQIVIESGKYEDLLKKQDNILLSENEIYPLSVRNILQELNPQEVSIVINTDTADYSIIQVKEKYLEGTIPPFELIKEKVEKRFVSLEKRKFINEYIKKLYSENDIEVKNQDNR